MLIFESMCQIWLIRFNIFRQFQDKHITVFVIRNYCYARVLDLYNEMPTGGSADCKAICIQPQ